MLENLPLWEIHPALVHFPIAFVLGAAALDLWAARRGDVRLLNASTALYVAGVATGLVAAGAGAVAFFTVPAHTEDAHVGMWWHLVVNSLSLAVLAVVAALRWRLRPAPPSTGLRVGGLAGALLLVFGAYLGGNVVYHGGAGVDPRLLAPEVRHEHVHTHGHVSE